MKKIYYALCLALISLSVFWNVSAYAIIKCPPNYVPGGNLNSVCVPGSGVGGSWEPSFPGGGGGFNGSGAGGSWGNSGGFSGNGGSGSPSSSSGFDASCQAKADTACKTLNPFGGFQSWYIRDMGNGRAFAGCLRGSDTGQTSISVDCIPDEPVICPSPLVLSTDGKTCNPPVCPTGQQFNGTQCIDSLKCPIGYKKEGNQCIWQCPVGFKDVGGTCVKDDQPEDCDPAIQDCTDDGKPKCDPCSKLQQLINNNLIMINNDNRIISLTETLVSNQNTTNNQLSNVNNNLTSINNNMNVINNSLQELITNINNNNPNIDTTAIENKLDQLINKQITIEAPEIDFSEIIQKLDVLNESIKASKYDDTQLLAKLDELFLDLTPIVDLLTLSNEKLDTLNETTIAKADETMGWLDTIVALLKEIRDALTGVNDCDPDDPECEPEKPDLPLEEVEAGFFDPWGALTGFDISQNRINASKQCPPDKVFVIMGYPMAIPFSYACTYLGYLAPIFLALAYFQGGMIILRSGD